MQNTPNIMQLESREYKLILKANNFTDKEKGRKEIIDILKNHFKKIKENLVLLIRKQKRKKYGIWTLKHMT